MVAVCIEDYWVKNNNKHNSQPVIVRHSHELSFCFIEVVEFKKKGKKTITKTDGTEVLFQIKHIVTLALFMTLPVSEGHGTTSQNRPALRIPFCKMDHFVACTWDLFH